MTDSEYQVTARHWEGGWELYLEDECVTQVRRLDQAVGQVRDYLATMRGADFSHATVNVVVDLDGLEREVTATRRETEAAAAAQRQAAERSRALARALRARGLSVADTAAVLGISRGRVSQLASWSAPLSERQLCTNPVDHP